MLRISKKGTAVRASALAAILTLSVANSALYGSIVSAEGSKYSDGHGMQIKDLGTEPNHRNDWVTANHDIYGSRTSDQKVIGKSNIDKLR